MDLSPRDALLRVQGQAHGSRTGLGSDVPGVPAPTNIGEPQVWRGLACSPEPPGASPL